MKVIIMMMNYKFVMRVIKLVKHVIIKQEILV